MYVHRWAGELLFFGGGGGGGIAEHTCSLYQCANACNQGGNLTITQVSHYQ